jgi:hypothetical protein
MGHRSNSPALFQLMMTEAIPPCELIDGPAITMHLFTDVGCNVCLQKLLAHSMKNHSFAALTFLIIP